MNKLLKKALLLSGMGFVIGILIGVSIFYFTGKAVTDDITVTLTDLFYFLVGGIYGALAMGGSVVYDIESWSIARATFTHFVMAVTGFFALAWIQGWFSPKDLFFWIMFAMWVFAYFIIWLCQYLSYQRQVERINRELKEYRNKKK